MIQIDSKIKYQVITWYFDSKKKEPVYSNWQIPTYSISWNNNISEGKNIVILHWSNWFDIQRDQEKLLKLNRLLPDYNIVVYNSRISYESWIELNFDNSNFSPKELQKDTDIISKYFFWDYKFNVIWFSIWTLFALALLDNKEISKRVDKLFLVWFWKLENYNKTKIERLFKKHPEAQNILKLSVEWKSEKQVNKLIVERLQKLTPEELFYYNLYLLDLFYPRVYKEEIEKKYSNKEIQEKVRETTKRYIQILWNFHWELDNVKIAKKVLSNKSNKDKIYFYNWGKDELGKEEDLLETFNTVNQSYPYCIIEEKGHSLWESLEHIVSDIIKL